MVLQLRPEPIPAPVAPLSLPARPALSVAPSVPPATQPAAKPVGLRSDRFALIFWLMCVGFMALLLLWDLVALLFK